MNLQFERCHVYCAQLPCERKSAHSNSCSITTLQCLEIEVVSKYKYLGVLIYDSLSFEPHIQYLVRKLKSKVGLF